MRSTYELGTPDLFVFSHTYQAVLYLLVVLIARFASQGLGDGFLRLAVLGELGRISYGLYLYHQMVRDLVFGVLFGTSWSGRLGDLGSDAGGVLAHSPPRRVVLAVPGEATHCLE